ncbi:hypothetical protein [Pseudomonas amygdali]
MDKMMDFEKFKALLFDVCGEHHQVMLTSDLFKSGAIDSVVLVELLAVARRQPELELNVARLGQIEIRTPADFMYVFEKY